MKKFTAKAESNEIIAFNNVKDSLFNYTADDKHRNETYWDSQNNYIRRESTGYSIKLDSESITNFSSSTHNVSNTIYKGEKGPDGEKVSTGKNFSRYSTICNCCKIDTIPESTDYNTLITNDGIALILFDNSTFILVDLFAEEDDGDNIDTEPEDLSALRINQTLLNSQGSSIRLIGYPSSNILEFNHDILYKKINNEDNKIYVYFFNPAIYSKSGTIIIGSETITIGSDGFMSSNNEDSKSVSSIYLPPRKSYIFKFKTTKLRSITTTNTDINFTNNSESDGKIIANLKPDKYTSSFFDNSYIAFQINSSEKEYLEVYY